MWSARHCGDVLRRLVARTMAKQCSKSAEAATAPFQCALQTRRKRMRLARAPDIDRSGPQRDNSVRGRGWSVRFDIEEVHVGRFIADRRRRQDVSFVMLFYSDPSVFLQEDELGAVHHVVQGEGWEQGDPLMPLLLCLGQHAALVAVAERLEVGERLVAFLDDLYVISSPERSVDVHDLLREELWRHSTISLHQSKTCIWNRGGPQLVVRSLKPQGSQTQQRVEYGEAAMTPGWKNKGSPSWVPHLAGQSLWSMHSPGSPNVRASCSRKSQKLWTGRVLLRPISTYAIVFFYLGQFYFGQVRLRPGRKLGG